LRLFYHVWKGFRALAVDPAFEPTSAILPGGSAGLVSVLVAGISSNHLTPGVEHVFLWLAIGMMYGQRARTPVFRSVSRQYVQLRPTPNRRERTAVEARGDDGPLP